MRQASAIQASLAQLNHGSAHSLLLKSFSGISKASARRLERIAQIDAFAHDHLVKEVLANDTRAGTIRQIVSDQLVRVDGGARPLQPRPGVQ